MSAAPISGIWRFLRGSPFRVDDVFSPEFSLYEGADVIYAIRPAIEMVPPLLALARAINSDLLVYHLGFETVRERRRENRLRCPAPPLF